MSNYCSSSNLQNRLTVAGQTWIADRDLDGIVSSSETAAYLTTAIEYATALIDAAIQGRWNVATAKGSGNVWLREIALDLAVPRAIEVGGRNVPQSIADARDRALEQLEEVRTAGRLIPGLAQPMPQRGTVSSYFRTPRAVNPR